MFLQNLSNVFKNGSKRWTATLALDAKVVSDVAVPRVVGWWMGGIAGMCFGAVVLGTDFLYVLYILMKTYCLNQNCLRMGFTFPIDANTSKYFYNYFMRMKQTLMSH